MDEVDIINTLQHFGEIQNLRKVINGAACNTVAQQPIYD